MYNLKNVKNANGGVLLLVKLQLKPASLLKVKLFPGCFSRSLNCTNGTKSCEASQIKVLKIVNVGMFFMKSVFSRTLILLI